MNCIKQETSFKLPAVIVCNIPEDSGDSETVVFMRDEARAETTAGPLRMGQGPARKDALIKLGGLAAA